MKIKVLYRAGVVLMVLGMGVVAVHMAGCEAADGTESGLALSSSSSGTLTPSNTTVELTVGGITNELAYPLEWSVSNPSLGSVAPSGKNSAIYRSNGSLGQNTVVAKDQYGNEAFFTINQVAAPTTTTTTLTSSTTTTTATPSTTTTTAGGGGGGPGGS